MVSLEQTLSPRNRKYILTVVICFTVVWSWNSVNRLKELAETADATGAGQDGSVASAADSSVQDLVRGAPAAKTAGSKLRGEQSEVPAVREYGRCTMLRNTDYWGDALVWGPTHRLDSAEQCCDACTNYKPVSETNMKECNVWVYCEDRELCAEHVGECWLKHLAGAATLQEEWNAAMRHGLSPIVPLVQAHPDAASPAAEGPMVGWTSGLMKDAEDVGAQGQASSDDRRFHIVITAQGTAVHWQARVAYYWYKKVKAKCEQEGNCQMGGFTRLLHSGEPDDLVAEIPTVVVDTLPPEHPNHGYVVLNRPYAFLQWINSATIPEKYVLMSEPDHLWLKPMPNLMKGQRPAAFPFFYIEPWRKDFLPITRKFLGPITQQEAEKIAPIGNAPTLMSLEDMKRVVPVWFNMSIAVHNDPEASKEWGWVQEMYAFTLSCTKVGITKTDLHKNMMSQPPYDTKLQPFYILHYTYGNDYDAEGNFTPGKIGEWRFDKRTYHTLPPPRNLGEPPPGMSNELVRHLIHAINEASSKIPGWDEYARLGQATQHWDGVL